MPSFGSDTARALAQAVSSAGAGATGNTAGFLGPAAENVGALHAWLPGVGGRRLFRMAVYPARHAGGPTRREVVRCGGAGHRVGGEVQRAGGVRGGAGARMGGSSPRSPASPRAGHLMWVVARAPLVLGEKYAIDTWWSPSLSAVGLAGRAPGYRCRRRVGSVKRSSRPGGSITAFSGESQAMNKQPG